jgi:hypothetical protein
MALSVGGGRKKDCNMLGCGGVKRREFLKDEGDF